MSTQKRFNVVGNSYILQLIECTVQKEINVVNLKCINLLKFKVLKCL